MFHRLLCLLYNVQEVFDPEIVPFGEYYPIPLEYYDELELIKGSNFRMYVSGDGKSYYILKRMDTEYLDAGNTMIYKQRADELEQMETVWSRLSEMMGYKPYTRETIGTEDFRRAVFQFAGRPCALTQSVVDRLDKEGMKEELIRSIIRMLKLMHEGNPPIAHLGLNPECIYICMSGESILPYIVDFDASRTIARRNEYPERGMIEDYFNTVDLKKFIAPEIRNSPEDEPNNPCAADIYSLGKLIRYVYGKNEKKVSSYVERLTAKASAKRPSIEEAGRAFDDEVVYFEPTVTLGIDVMDEFRLLIFTPFHGFDNHLISDTVTVGRMYSSDGKDIKVDSPIASRTHGRFVKTATGFEYSDMLSTNGTFINGVLYGAQRQGKTEPKALRFGDILKIDTPEMKRAHKNAVYMFVLAPSHRAMKQYEIDIEEGLDVCIGRERGDIILPNNRVSKKHARFVEKNGKVFVQDLNSTNGLYVNGKPARKSVRLYPMDSVRIEEYVFVLTEKKIYYCAE
jgi:pSer/pThr/pTyr-binding forkhead associated (FHA) protein